MYAKVCNLGQNLGIKVRRGFYECLVVPFVLYVARTMGVNDECVRDKNV